MSPYPRPEGAPKGHKTHQEHPEAVLLWVVGAFVVWAAVLWWLFK